MTPLEPGDEPRIGLNTLKPAPGSRKARKRVGRGEGSGTGKTSGRGQKGWGSRSGAKRRARFEGGQNPIHMRMRKLRGPHMKKSMPFEMFRTHTQAVNLQDLERRFEAGDDVTLAALQARGLGTRKGVAVKILADVQPVPPTGGMFEPVEFENLMVTPYANDKGRMAFSFRATAIVAPRGGKAAPVQGGSAGKAAA